MPRRYRRRYAPKRKYARKRRPMAARRRRAVLNRQVHSFKRTAFISQITASKVSGVQQNINGAYAFSLDMLPGVAEFTSLFDQYKINAVKIQFIPGTTQTTNSVLDPNPTSSNITGAAMCYNRFHSVIDYDDTTLLGSEAAALEYGSLKSSRGDRGHTRYLKPKVVQDIFRTGGATGKRPIGNQWIDCNNTDVPHYGLKVWMDAPDSPTNIAITYNVYVTMYFQCKNTR